MFPEFSSSVRRLSRISCHKEGFILHNSLVFYSLFVTKLFCFFILSLEFGSRHWLLRCSLGFINIWAIFAVFIWMYTNIRSHCVYFALCQTWNPVSAFFNLYPPYFFLPVESLLLVFRLSFFLLNVLTTLSCFKSTSRNLR